MTATDTTPTLTISQSQKRQLITDGYIVLRGAIPPQTVELALRMINARMGQGISAQDIAQSPASGFFKEVTHVEPFKSMVLNAAMLGVINSLIGGTQPALYGRPQLALRFPTMGAAGPQYGCHLDGLHTPTNGVPKGEIRSFTGLVGTFLSRVDRPMMGNFTVWPGGHQVIADWFKQHDYRDIKTTLPPVESQLGAPTPILVEPGDMVLANYLLPHGVSPNTSSSIRYACFNRIRHPRLEEERFPALQQPWLHWEGLRDCLP